MLGVLVMCRGALSCTAVCDCPFCARGHCQVTVPEPQWFGAGLSMNPAARTVTVPLPGSHEHEVPSLSLSLESYVCQVAPRTCVRCPRASLSEGVTLRRLPIPPALVRASPRQQPIHRRLFEKEFVCNLMSVWECRLLVHERDSQLAVHSTARLHTLSYPMSTSGDFHPFEKTC